MHEALQQLLNEGTRNDEFPLEALPEPIQQIIESFYHNLKWPKDYLASSMLFTTSVAAGSRFRIQVKYAWEEAPGVYILFVGHPGVAKSHAMKWPMRPIIEEDRFNYKQYKQQLDEYDRIQKMTKKELEDEGIAETKKEPILQKKIVEDITLEGLIKVLNENPHGLGANFDEASSWFKNFNRYNNGSDIGTWLKLWNQGDVIKDRVGSKPIRLDKPFVSLIGGIQPKILKDVQDQQMEDNGMLDRILFAWPRSQRMESIPENDAPMEEHFRNWNVIINRILNFDLPYPSGFKYHRYVMSKEARQRFFEWDKSITQRANDHEEVWFRGVSAKMRSQVVRISLLLELLQYGLGNDHKYGMVTEKSLSSAISICEYFIKTATRVREELHDLNPLRDAPTDIKRLYSALPDTFQRKEGVEVAKEMRISTPTFDRLLKTKGLFAKAGYGVYEKTK